MHQYLGLGLLSDAQPSRVERSIVLSPGVKNEVLSSDGLTSLINSGSVGAQHIMIVNL